MSSPVASIVLTAQTWGIYPKVRVVEIPHYPETVPVGRASKSVSKGLVGRTGNAWFDSPVMSRKHAQISHDTILNNLMIEDIGAMHGTRINNVLLTPNQRYILRTNDILVFGAEVRRGQEIFPACSFKIDCLVSPATSDAIETGASSSRTFRVPYESDIEEEGEEDDRLSYDGTPHHVDSLASGDENTSSSASVDAIDLTRDSEPQNVGKGSSVSVSFRDENSCVSLLNAPGDGCVESPVVIADDNEYEVNHTASQQPIPSLPKRNEEIPAVINLEDDSDVEIHNISVPAATSHAESADERRHRNEADESASDLDARNSPDQGPSYWEDFDAESSMWGSEFDDEDEILQAEKAYETRMGKGVFLGHMDSDVESSDYEANDSDDEEDPVHSAIQNWASSSASSFPELQPVPVADNATPCRTTPQELLRPANQCYSQTSNQETATLANAVVSALALPSQPIGELQLPFGFIRQPSPSDAAFPRRDALAASLASPSSGRFYPVNQDRLYTHLPPRCSTTHAQSSFLDVMYANKAEITKPGLNKADMAKDDQAFNTNGADVKHFLDSKLQTNQDELSRLRQGVPQLETESLNPSKVASADVVMTEETSVDTTREGISSSSSKRKISIDDIVNANENNNDESGLRSRPVKLLGPANLKRLEARRAKESECCNTPPSTIAESSKSTAIQDNNSTTANLASATEQRPAKRLRRFAEAVGYAALGGVAVGAGLFSVLVATAPDFA